MWMSEYSLSRKSYGDDDDDEQDHPDDGDYDDVECGCQ